MRYFVRSAEGAPEKGPYERENVLKSYEKGLLGKGAKARAEDGEEWISLETLFAEDDKRKKQAEFVRSGPPPDEHVPEPGVFLHGFLAGFFGGCIGFLLVTLLAKGPETKRGAAVGFAIQAVVGLLIRALALSSH